VRFSAALRLQIAGQHARVAGLSLSYKELWFREAVVSLRTILSILLLPLLAVSTVQAVESTDFLPAGMLLNCVIDEPNFSSKTAAIGDPILCHLGTTTAFGRQAFPRGSYLTGHLDDARAPGHFFGKGSLSIQFDRLVLPGEGVLPLAAKVVSVPKYKVARDGRIDGKGHAKRDAVEWAIPVLWPVKVLTLPARGPYPTLKGEVRITLRLMEDAVIPTRVASVPMPPWVRPRSSSRPVSLTLNPDYRLMSAVDVRPAARYPVTVSVRESASGIAARKPTLLVMKDHSAYLVEAYWLDRENIRCVMQSGENKLFPMTNVDFTETVRINGERKVAFALQAK
jgi:hypothetical protein